MKKTVTALMVVLPLLFLIALFAITSASSVSAAIPANGISINNKGESGIFSFDIANYNAPMYESDLGVEVLPYKAKNRKYSLSITDANTGEDTSIVTKNEDGSFSLNDVGMAKLTYTSDDGGYTDSVIFNVACSGVLDYTPAIKEMSGQVQTLTKIDENRYSASIETGSFVLGGDYYPNTATSVQPRFYAQNDDVIKINAISGKISAYFATTTQVNMSVVNAHGETVTKTIQLAITNPNTVSVNGTRASLGSATHTVRAPLNTKSFTIYVDAKGASKDSIVLLAGLDTCSYEVKAIDSISSNAYAVEITLDDAVTAQKTSPWAISINGTRYYFDVAFSEYEFLVNSFGNADGKAELVLLEGKSTEFAISCEPDENLSYEWSIQNTDIAYVEAQHSNMSTIKALKSGKTTLLVNWSKIEGGKVVASGRIERDVIVTKAYTSLIFNESITSYGLGNLAIANKRYDSNGNIVSANYKTTLFNNLLNASKAQEEITAFDDILFSSDRPGIATVSTSDTGIEFVIKDNGTVTICAQWIYGERFNVKPASITFTAVNGVYVATYSQLVDAGQKAIPIVLENDIYLGENLFDDNGKAKYDDATMKEKLLSFTGEITTTFDSQYYKNIYGADYQAKVRYCYEFTANTYGNGHTLNAEYITHMFDNTGNLRDYALFRGPLNFVAANMSGVDVASVKGQDNICFLVRKPNVTLDNVVLAGCNDEALYDDEQIELNLLNYTGTTLELMNDATVKNCRVKNGRTVVRVHGKADVDLNSAVNATEEKISVTIQDCRLQTAREFILKIGTNRVKRGTLVEGDANSVSPYLYKANGEPYTAYNSSACDAYKDDEYFVNNYVLTDVTLKNSTLSTSGLFAIGMESHFSGAMLEGGSQFKLDGWSGLAGTSYPAMLHLVGNVVLDDWKELSAVDSSTLIETNINSSQQNLAFLSLNVGAMLNAVKDVGEYSNILYNNGTANYVHGGIAFYGGGKNYSILDTSQYTFESMNQYNINISVLENAVTDDAQETANLNRQGQLLPLAAGMHDFRFVMFDATSTYKPAN